MQNYLKLVNIEPYRVFFPLGVISLLWGALLWLPLLWDPSEYPVLVHRYLMLNGFTGSFIGGFLMTAVPKFSKTSTATKLEILLYFSFTVMGLFPAYLNLPEYTFFVSSLQPLVLLIFLIRRISNRQENPPYSFIFIFVGLFLWLISGILSAFFDLESFKHLHYEGAIASIILGVGSRLIPGILGHVEIVKAQREKYEQMKPILQTVPLHFVFLIISFGGSYFLEDFLGAIIRATVVGAIGFAYWRLWRTPIEKSSLSRCIGFSGWLIVISFFLKASWSEGIIHISHSFFINGIVLLSLLIATRVLQSHGPKDKTLEESKVLYVVSSLVLIASVTRVSAFLMPENYLTHLGYSSIILALAVALWSWKYLRYVGVKR